MLELTHASAAQTNNQPLMSGPLSGRVIIHRIIPIYPSWARKQTICGSIRLFLTATSKGDVQSTIRITRSSGNAELDNIAIEALRQWKFSSIDDHNSPTEWGWGIATFLFDPDRGFSVPESPKKDSRSAINFDAYLFSKQFKETTLPDKMILHSGDLLSGFLEIRNVSSAVLHVSPGAQKSVLQDSTGQRIPLLYGGGPFRPIMMVDFVQVSSPPHGDNLRPNEVIQIHLDPIQIYRSKSAEFLIFRIRNLLGNFIGGKLIWFEDYCLAGRPKLKSMCDQFIQRVSLKSVYVRGDPGIYVWHVEGYIFDEISEKSVLLISNDVQITLAAQ